MMNIKNNLYKVLVLFITMLVINNVTGQTAQTINPGGGASANLDDGLKVVVNPTGILSVYRQDQTQYYPGYTWPEGKGNGVRLTFRFDNGTLFNTLDRGLYACSTTQATQDGNNWTTSISGYVMSPISNKKFFVTMNFKYTNPDRYFLVDYYIRAPFDLPSPETVHLYLSHDAFILGSDGSLGYETKNATGHFVGDYRTNIPGSCDVRSKNPRYPSTHGFKTSGKFRSYYSGLFANRNNINNSTLMLANMINTSCVDDGIAVEFTIGTLSAGQTGAKQVLHGYGNNKGEFDNTVVTDPTPPTGQSTPVTVNFESGTSSELEGDDTHLANAIKIVVSGGHLVQEQVCNFGVVGGTATQDRDYTYVKGFIIPAGDYTTPKTFTLNNFTILGNTICQNDRTINIKIETGVCNDLIQAGTTSQTTYTIKDDDTPSVNQPADLILCKGERINSIVFSGNILPNITYTWTNSNTAIGLSSSGTGNLPAFIANNTTGSPITATITVTPKQGSCPGTPKQFTITVRSVTNPGTIAGNPFVCAGVKPLPIKGEPSTGGSGLYTYQWQQSANNVTWTDISGATGLDYAPEVLTSNTYFRRNTIDASCGTFVGTAFFIKIVSTPTSLYWKTNATDNDWNNPTNWVDKSGTELGMVPLACTDVHIPGGANKYPSLDTISTNRKIYGEPICQNIVFHYGGEVAYPHNLVYEKAYVQYNWGYYNRTSGISPNSQPTVNVDGSSAPKMQRGKWYTLAAPLKNMVSGDFALAGYPLTWQAVYNMPNPAIGILESSDFSSPFATNDVNLTQIYGNKTNNSIALKVAPYDTNIGYNNQRSLEGLKGVIEIPYFENKAQEAFHPGHQYDPVSKKSTLFYFDTKTLKQIYSPIGQIKRSNEAYRFVFENDDNTVGYLHMTGGPKVKGYGTNVLTPGPSRRVMVGNPFMASINSLRLYEDNRTFLDRNEGYKLFSPETQTWVQYSFSETNNIGPLQAFVLTSVRGLAGIALRFPLEGPYALTGAQFRGSQPRSVNGSSLYVRSVNSQNKETEYAVLSTNDNPNVKKMVSKEGHATPEVFFVSPVNEYNLIQVYDDKTDEIRLGVKTSNTKDVITLEFSNVDDFASIKGVNPILDDKFLNIKQDLLKNNTYSFNQQKQDSTTQYADVDRFVLRLPKSTTGIFDNDEKNEDKSVVITYERNELSVYADNYLSQVLVYDLNGREVHNSGDLGTTSLSYVKYVQLSQGSYIVKVKTAEGKIVAKKIVTQ